MGCGVGCANRQGLHRACSQGLPVPYHCWLQLPGELRRLEASLEKVAGDSGLISCMAEQVGIPWEAPPLSLPLEALTLSSLLRVISRTMIHILGGLSQRQQGSGVPKVEPA